MNTFGRLLRVHLIGESHSSCVGVLVEGCPAGLPLCEDDLRPDLQRRLASESAQSPKDAAGAPRIASGMLCGTTTGTPILILLDRGQTDGGDGARGSKRPDTGLVAAGAIARRLLPGVRFATRVFGTEASPDRVGATGRTGSGTTGVVECRASGVPPGRGTRDHSTAEPLFADALLAIPEVRSIEIGERPDPASQGDRASGGPVLDRDERRGVRAADGNNGRSAAADLVFRVAMRSPSSEVVDRVEAVVALVLADLVLGADPVPRVVPPPPSDLAGLRSRVDDLDEQLVAMLSERLEVARHAAEHKPSVLDEAREEEVLARVRRLAREPLEPDLAEALWKTLLAGSRRLQARPSEQDTKRTT